MPQLDPETILDPDRFLDYEHSVKRSALVDRALELIDRPGLSLCDVGGASGIFAAEITRRSPHAIEATILEVTEAYRTHLADRSIRFMQGSIVDNALAADQFDIVTARHILHHLVADSVQETKRLQHLAIAEMARITRPGGYILIEEEVNRNQVFSRIVYYLSRLACRRRIRVRFFETGRVVVSFMTPAELAQAIRQTGQSIRFEVLEEHYQPRTPQWRWRLTLLMANVGNLLYVLRKEN